MAACMEKIWFLWRSGSKESFLKVLFPGHNLSAAFLFSKGFFFFPLSFSPASTQIHAATPHPPRISTNGSDERWREMELDS